MAGVKTIPFFQSIRVALGAGATDTVNGKITAANSRRITIEQIVDDTRKSSDLSVTDAQVLVNLKDKTNNSYTNGQVPRSALAGKATTGMPKFLPMKIVIEPNGELTAELQDLSNQANTVDLCFIGYVEVMG